jgi:O-antigen ligase
VKISTHLFVELPELGDLDKNRRHEPWLMQRATLLGLCGLLIFGVLAFGAVEKWAIFGFEAGASILFLFWAGNQFSGQAKLSKNTLYLPAFLFFALILIQVLLRTSAYRYVTKYELLKYVSYGIVLLIGSECITQQRDRKIFSLVMVAFGAMYAFFALAQELTANGKIFWFFDVKFPGSIYGSYVDHDHYAGLMEMLVPIPLVISMGQLLTGAKRVLVGSCAVLMAGTIFLSRSRAGMLAFILEMAIFATITLSKKRSPRIAWGSMAICVLILALLTFLGKGQVLGRLGDLSPGIRLQIDKDSLRMFSKRPILGWGLGTFSTVYPRFRSFYMNQFVNEAHNDYVQLLTETGLLGFALMLWFLVRLYRKGLPISGRWETRWDAAVSVAALLGCTGILFHSFLDFNLQIPANAALFYVLCGLAVSDLPVDISAGQMRPSRRRGIRHPLPGREESESI